MVVGVMLLLTLIGFVVWLSLRKGDQKQTAIPFNPDEMLLKLQNQIQTTTLDSVEKLLSSHTQNLENLMKASSQEVFQTQSQSFVDVARNEFKKETEFQKKEIESLVKPLSESIAAYKKEIDQIEAGRNKEYGGLNQLIKTLVESNDKLKSETSHLVNALKRPTVRGRWGEIQLRRVVELAGMTNHVDFEEQNSVDGDDGKLRPDMVVKLPGQRTIVIDSKAVLAAYFDAEALANDDLRKAALTRHAISIKTRVTELSRKNYWEQFKNAPEFVVLFIPAEAFLSAALNEMPEILEEAFKQKVVIATPSTLVSLLRAVAYGWRNEALAENSKRIAEHATRLYQALSVWTGHLNQVGVSLDRAVKSYNASMGSLERTVLPPARRMRELGITTKDDIAEIKTVETTTRDLGIEENLRHE
jgi:DNA recombination protein RmuC